MMPILPRMGEMPSNWLTYFESADIRKSVDQAKSLGAEVFVDVTPIPQWGQFAVLADPQCASFALFQRNA
jgi:predicted enzyme related to lactoylglutathione lyase